jgi:hypothetical protein
MYVYIYSNGVYTVGFFKSNGEWVPESDHDTDEEAAERVHYLNGGSDDDGDECIAESVRRIADAKRYMR